QFSRDGSALVATGNLTGDAGRGGISGRARGGAPAAGTSYRAIFKDVAPGTVDAEIQITSTANTLIRGVFFAIALPGADYAGGSAQLIAPTTAAGTPVSLPSTRSSDTNLILRASAKGVRVVSTRRQIELNLPAPTELVIREVRSRGKSEVEVSF